MYTLFKKEIALALSKIDILSGLSEGDLLFLLDASHKKKIKSGDLCIQLGKLNKFKLKFDKKQLSDNIVSTLLANCPNVEQACADKNYINVFLNHSTLARATMSTIFSGNGLGEHDIGKGATVYVEYSSPNIAKPFHVGHLRSTILGSFICKIHKKMGYRVVSENYLGDWGKQYGLLALAYEMYGDPDQLKKTPIKHLYELYVRINKEALLDPDIHEKARGYFKKMELGNKKYLSLWQKMRDLSIEEYKKIYSQLNITFDIYGGESMHSQGVIEQMDILRKGSLLSEVNGAKIVELSGKGMSNAVVTKSDGTTLYITRDLAAAASRWEKYKFEKMFYVVAVPQTLHFKQMFKILEKMGYEWSARCKHVPFGLVKGMSTRRGDVVFLTDVFDEAKAVMLKQMKDSEKTKFSEIKDPEGTAEMIGLSSIFIGDMGAKRIKDYSFDWERITSFEGDTGPYIQYTHARLCSIERKAKEKRGWDVGSGPMLFKDVLEYELLSEPECRNIVQKLGMYSNAVLMAFKTLEPSTVVQYLFGLCHAVSSGISVLNVINADENTGKIRLALFHAARVVVGDALMLLGLNPLIRM